MRRILKSSFLALLLLPNAVFAAVEITHVEYDLPGSDAGREWIEITNKGADAADLSGFRLLEADTKHKLTLAQGSWLLPSGESAVIADDPAIFLSEHAGFTKSLYKSSFSLSNTGETLSLVTASGTIESSHTYQAAPPQKAPAKTAASKSKTSPSSVPKQTAAVSDVAPAAFSTQTSGGSSLPAILPWYLGLGAVMGLGIAGAMYALPKRKDEPETKDNADEFEIE